MICILHYILGWKSQFNNQVRDSKLEFVTSNLYLSKTTAQNMLKNYNAMMVTYDQG